MNALLKRPTGVALSALTILRKILRKFFRLILLISLLGGLFTVTARYGVPSYEVPKPPRLEEAGLPPLKTLKPIPVGGLDINLKSGGVQIALELDRQANDADLTSDIIEIYRWGRGYFKPVLCGPEHPPNMCVVGYVDIVLVGREDIFTPTGQGEGYVTVVEMGLNQIQIDSLLRDPPANFDKLLEFLSQVAEKTLGTEGWIQAFDPPTPFTGFK